MIQGWMTSRRASRFRSGFAWGAIGAAVLLGFGLLGRSAHAGESIYAQTFRNFAPPASGKCSLKSFSISAYDLGFEETVDGVGESSRGTAVATVVETSDASCAREYAVVQYIRGCAYDIEQNDRTGKFDRYFGTVIDDPNGTSVPFKFDEWTVDSVDPDPMYYSAPASSASDPHRFDGLLYAKRPLRLDGTDAGLAADYLTAFTAKHRGFVKELGAAPKQMFSFDLPVMSSWYGYADGRNSVTNTSLEFKVCLYATKDVPLRGRPAGFDAPADAGGPIHCFDWNSRNEFDFVTKKFVAKAAIDPFCASPLPAKRRPQAFAVARPLSGKSR